MLKITPGEIRSDENSPYSESFTLSAENHGKIISPDELADTIFDTVMTVANTHQPGAGKIYVINVEKNG
ncbi:MAG: P-II family nitrogen regulator, partial [Nitrosomonas sp.]|nr:P-II family nitrogen regulator [Nitrosomonas sp.]